MIGIRYPIYRLCLISVYLTVIYFMLQGLQGLLGHLGGTEVSFEVPSGIEKASFSKKLPIHQALAKLTLDERFTKGLPSSSSKSPLSLSSMVHSFCQQSLTLLSSHSSWSSARQNILSHCSFIEESVLPKMFNMLSKKELSLFEREKRSLARSLYQQHFYMRRLMNSSVMMKESEVWEQLTTLFRRVHLEVSSIEVEENFETKRRLRVTKTAASIQARLESNQRSLGNCEKGKRLFCHFVFSGGFAYGVNRLIWCLATAAILQRRLVHGAKHNIEPSLFHSILVCNDTHSDMVSPAIQYSLSAKDVSLMPRPVYELGAFLPGNLPRSWVASIVNDVDDISVWYVGQLTRFVMTPTVELEALLTEHGDRVGINIGGPNPEPIVGVHIRRGDKKKESSPQPVSKYIEMAEDYFIRLELMRGEKVRRKLFLATDDDDVLDEVKTLAPHYIVSRITMEGVKYAQRHWYRPVTLQSIVIDMFMLVHADHFVGTLSSNVGCVVYQLRQSVHMDAFDSTVSLDSLWWMNLWNTKPIFRARMTHVYERLEGEQKFVEGGVVDSTATAMKQSMRGFESEHLEGVNYGSVVKEGIANSGTYPIYKVDFDPDLVLFDDEELDEYIKRGPSKHSSLPQKMMGTIVNDSSIDKRKTVS